MAPAPVAAENFLGTTAPCQAVGPTHPQVIGAAAAEAPSSRKQDSAPAGAACSRLPLLFLVIVAVAACTAVGAQLHAPSHELHKEVQRLKDENQALLEQARLAKREQQDLARLILDDKSRHRVANLMERSKAFDAAAQHSGFKDSVESTSTLRNCLGQVMPKLNITSLLDVPCRDASWQHLLPNIADLAYVGADINIRALETAKHRPENVRAGLEFMLFDAVHFPLKRSFDLVLFRGLIEHQRVQDSLTALLNFKTSGSRYVAANYWPQSPAEANEAAHNLDHKGWYEANLLAAPFSFPEPLVSCPDGAKGTDQAARSRLGIWRLSDLHAVTPVAVQQAAPENHRVGNMQFQPRWVHVPGLGSPWATATANHAEEDVTLDDLMGIFGSAFSPARQHLRQREVEDNPFDGLFSDWLETSGPALRGHGHRQVALPTQVFRMPSFAQQLR